MTQTTHDFFQEYANGTQTSDTGTVAKLYAESFMFAGPQGTQVVNRDGFVRSLPKRQEWFNKMGLRRTALESVEETRLDDFYSLVKAVWTMQFDREPGEPVKIPAAATYILHRRGDSFVIVFQLDHVDWMSKAQELGLL